MSGECNGPRSEKSCVNKPSGGGGSVRLLLLLAAAVIISVCTASFAAASSVTRAATTPGSRRHSSASAPSLKVCTNVCASAARARSTRITWLCSRQICACAAHPSAAVSSTLA